MKHINTNKKIIVKVIKNADNLKKELKKLKKKIPEPPDFSGKARNNPAKVVRYYFLDGQIIEI